MKKITTILLLSIGLFSFSCKKSKEVESFAKKEVEVRITYNAVYSQYHLLMSLQATSIDGGLPPTFAFNGLTTSPIQGMIHEASIIHGAEFTTIPTSTQSFKTSQRVSTLGIFLSAIPLTDIGMPLNVTLDFYVDGKKTTTGNATFSGPITSVQGFVIDVTNPGTLIETNDIGG